MPNIKETANGKYEFWLDLGRDPATGKRRQVHRSGFKRKKDALEEIRRLQNEADVGIFVNKRKATITFAEFADEWLEYYKATSGNKESTYRSRKTNITAFNKIIGNVKMADMTKQRYEKLLIELDKRYQKNTFNLMHITAGMIFDYAVECNLLASNPAKAAKKPKKAKTLEDVEEDIVDKFLSKDELNIFLATVRNYGDLQYYALFRLLAYSGLRIGEALALEISKFDLNARVLKVRQTYCSDTNKTTDFYLQTPKTDASIRDVDIDTETTEILQMWIGEQKRNKMRQRDIWYDEHDFIFTSSKYPGYPLPYYTAHKMFNKLLSMSNINTNLTPHALRHTHASLLAESGATLEQIQARLGHDNDDITRRIYLHVTKSSKANMVDNFARFMQA